VRLKNYLEMRGADGGKWARICALPALWVGLLYDQNALQAAWDEVKHWTLEQRQALRDAVPQAGLTARTPDGETLQVFGQRILDLAQSGLSARARLNASGDNETGFLATLRDTLASGESPADGCCGCTIMIGRATSAASMKKRALGRREAAVYRWEGPCVVSACCRCS
jgi:glutamate--cysteine ligase